MNTTRCILFALMSALFTRWAAAAAVDSSAVPAAIALDTTSIRVVKPVPLSSLRWASVDRVTLDGHIPGETTELRPVPFIVTTAVYATAIVGLHIYQSNAWWSKDRRSFHIQEDWPENLQNDKFGHFFGAYLQASMVREALLMDGLSDGAAHTYGSVFGALYSLYVEVEDGFASQWGFSPTDAYSDLAGAGFFFAQRHVPVLQNFHEKWSYWPSKFLGSGSIPGQQRTVFDDYQGQSFWWCADVWNMLPPSGQAWYPKWLQVGIGYSARKYGPYLGPAPAGTPNPSAPQYTDLPDTREVYVGLDYCLPHLIPKTGLPVIDWLVQSFDNFHFPAPAVRLAPTVKAYLLFPIRFRIGSLQF